MKAPARIGLDFDNTIAGYDRVFLNAAKAAYLLPADFSGNKKDVRNAVRLNPDGDFEWQRLQGHVYGKLMSQATLIDGVEDFLLRCRNRSIPISIISHKTEFGHFDPDRVSLHDVARRWLKVCGFFDRERYALVAEDIYFEATRAEKIARISDTGCSHFVDDLEDVFLDPNFPGDVEAVLYTGAKDDVSTGPCTVCRDWREVADAVLG